MSLGFSTEDNDHPLPQDNLSHCRESRLVIPPLPPRREDVPPRPGVPPDDR
ncbi:MAG TPA: hypothetical protein VG099_26920 [Gemmataceae bacterium]|nr:hypothetical protein [Gemmataceae bacterium]